MKRDIESILGNLDERISHAVKHFWETRVSQKRKQETSGKADQGARSMVTGGAQMYGFITLMTDIIISSGIDEKYIYFNKNLELPGYFRATKEWDLLVVKNGQLLAVLEAKSQIGSFGNNFNNRTEEAIGSATDLWTAYREGAINNSIKPWLGYFILLEDCEKSRKPIHRVNEPHFKVFPEFYDASYQKRYNILCQKLKRERLYDASALIISDSENGLSGKFDYPSKELSLELFIRSLIAQLLAYAEK